MSRIYFIIIAPLIAMHIFAQNQDFLKPDYSAIRKEVFDNNSKYFYPKLYDRFLAGDTNLNLEDFRHLYYGYTFQSQYIPYRESRYQEKMLGYLKKGTLNTKELAEFIKLSELNLKDLPFDIRTLNILSYSYKQKNDIVNSELAEFKKLMIIKAIFSSGNGFSEQTAFHVIDPAHEFDIINELGFKFGGASDLSNALCDYLIVQPNEQNVRGYYFDLSRLLHAKTERNN